MTQSSRTFWIAYDVVTGLIAVAVSTDILIRFGVGSITWLLVYMLVALRLALVWRAAFDLLVRNWPYLLYPAVCGASVLWSVNTTGTLTAAVQLSMTIVIAMFVGWRFSLGAICLLQLCGTSAGLALSLVNWATGAFGEVYAALGGLLGIYTQKNMLGQNALYATLSMAAILLSSRIHAGATFKLIVIGGLAVTAFLLWLSKAVTAILMVPALVGLLIALNAQRLPRPLVLFAVAGGLMTVALAPVGLAVAAINPVDAVLDAFGKSSSLTGRTDLWAMAMGVIADHPFVGVGFQAFWSSAAFADLAAFAKNFGETVTSFHNVFLEVWVGTGLFGVVAMLALLGTTLWRTVRLWLLTRSLMASYAIVGTLGAVILNYVGTGLYRQHEHAIMFVVMVGIAAQRELRALGR